MTGPVTNRIGPVPTHVITIGIRDVRRVLPGASRVVLFIRFAAGKSELISHWKIEFVSSNISSNVFDLFPDVYQEMCSIIVIRPKESQYREHLR